MFETLSNLSLVTTTHLLPLIPGNPIHSFSPYSFRTPSPRSVELVLENAIICNSKPHISLLKRLSTDRSTTLRRPSQTHQKITILSINWPVKKATIIERVCISRVSFVGKGRFESELREKNFEFDVCKLAELGSPYCGK